MTAVTIQGDTVTVSDEAFAAGTEYGFDWDVAFPEPLSISGSDLTQALRLHGIWTLEDALANPQEVQAAVLALSKVIITGIVRRARECIVN